MVHFDELEQLLAVVAAAKSVAKYAHDPDCATIAASADGLSVYARHWVPCDCSVNMLRAALRAQEERKR